MVKIAVKMKSAWSSSNELSSRQARLEKIDPFSKFHVRNPSKSFSVVTVFVYVWGWMLFYLRKLLLWVSSNLKVIRKTTFMQDLDVIAVTGADPYLVSAMSRKSVRVFTTTQKPRKEDSRELKSKTFLRGAWPDPSRSLEPLVLVVLGVSYHLSWVRACLRFERESDCLAVYFSYMNLHGALFFLSFPRSWDWLSSDLTSPVSLSTMLKLVF